MARRPIVGHLTRRHYFRTPGLPVQVRTYYADTDVPPHDHDFVELVLVLSGRGTHVTFANRRPLAAGHLLLVRPGAWHAYEWSGRVRLFNCLVEPEFVQVDLYEVLARTPLASFLLAEAGTPALHEVLHLTLVPAGLRTARQALGELERLGSSADQFCRMVSLLLLVLQAAGEAMTNPATPAAALATTNPLVKRGIALLSDRLTHDWTLGELARRLGASPAHVSRSFTRCTGRPPLSYLEQLRLQRAAASLLHTDQPISAIAAGLGWLDPNYFARRFRRQFGISAGAYRQRHRLTEQPR